MDRRQFLFTASAGALAVASSRAGAADAPAAPKPFAIDSPPVLQNPTPDGVTVAWAVTGPSTGWVEYGPTEQLGRRADAAANGLLAFEPRFLSVRLTGLSRGEPVYYRVVSVPVTFRGPYKIERGQPVTGDVRCYRPPHVGADIATFAVLNDTHEKLPTLAALTAALAKDPADLTVYNGDVFDDIHDDEQVAKCVLRPAGAAYAAERPLLFVPGNHDYRGVAARGLSRAFTPWPGDPQTSRNFAVRHGPFAIVGLDTGEDKPDRHPAWAGLAAFEPYHEVQRDWLATALQRPEIASAPYLVICCHIPLWGLPGENGGDTLQGSADFHRHAQQLWHPLIAKARAQLLISGHTHQHRYDAPNAERSYGQLIGGGPKLEQSTLIRGRADKEKLELVMLAGADGKELGRWAFAPRRV